MTPIVTLKWMGPGVPHKASILDKELLATNSLSQRRTHQLVTQYQMVSTENTQTSNTVQTEQVIFMYSAICYIYTYCITTIKEKEAINLKENKEEGTWENLEGGNGGGNDVTIGLVSFANREMQIRMTVILFHLA